MKILHILLLLGLFILLFLEFFHPITAINQDLGRHIISGSIIVATHNVYKTNLFSYTYPDFPFINTHWLSEVVFFLIVSVVGFKGLLMITTITVFISFALLLAYVIKKAHIVAITMTSLLFFLILAERTDVRPEIFSMLFTILFVTILYRYREKFTKLIFFLPIIEILWVNIHIYFIIGVGITGLFVIDALITNRKNLLSAKHLSKHVLFLFLTCVLVILATLCNPNGRAAAIYPFTVMHNYGYAIQENQNIFFLINYGPSRTIPYFITAVLLLLTCLGISYKKTRPIDWLLAIVFSYIGAIEIRNFILFIFATFIPFTLALSNTMTLLSRHLSSTYKKYATIGICCLLCLVMIWEASSFVSQRRLGWSMPEQGKNALDFFIYHNLKGPIFNDFDIGSYLDYRLYPKERVFLDGRPEAYPDTFFKQQYIPMEEDPRFFAKEDRRYHFNAIIFSHTDQTPWAQSFLQTILKNPQWRIVYLNSNIVILLKNNVQNMQVIKKFGMDDTTAHISEVPDEAITDLYQLSNFFITAGWTNQLSKMDQKILSIKPNTCPVIAQLANIYHQANNPSAQMYINQYETYCR